MWTSYRGASNCFAFDNTQKYIGLTNTTVIFDTNPNVVSLKYILALLNSKLLDFRYNSIGKQTGGGIFEYFF
ncbi:TaqI-like C-terminal specificity domain-containing protein [Methylocucumis oryzae]|uniref:TaqI-like C-terminal specificity domain-containing protein n=1 Tax=Methylocucumis oryzae TaxID=1632867 RepID=UPI0034DF8A30